ncbi:MAG: RNA polymerase sigma factor [Candidatus Kapabacteria bacterium]|nr:RNA polymerase sigma factor [Candidatus Kapabacteria bacterium]
MTESEKKTEFLKLYNEVHPNLLRFARAMTKSRDEGRDLASETILIAYERFDKVKSRQAFLSYLFSIATRIHKRRRWRLRFFGEYDEIKAGQLVAQISSPDVGPDVEILYQALDKLPVKMKETVILFEISGLNLEEICEIQGGSLSGVKSRLVRGRAMLKEILTSDRESDTSSATESQNGYNKNGSTDIFAKQKSIEIGVS